MARVRFDSKTNSTKFTTCCGCAICDDESRCPSCGEEVPYDAKERWDMCMYGEYGYKETLEMRRKWRAKDAM